MLGMITFAGTSDQMTEASSKRISPTVTGSWLRQWTIPSYWGFVS